MDFEMTWTGPARQSLIEIVDYLSERSPVFAERFLAKISKRIELLRSSLFLGAEYKMGKAGPIRELLSGKYRVFYQVLEEVRRIRVLLVWHGARQEPELD